MTNVQAEARDGVHVIRIDDGKVNALSPAVVQDVHGALDEATDAGHAVLLCGRPGFLGAGFDLKVMRGDPDERAQLVAEGRRLLLRLFVHERPVVVACTGNAIAAGPGSSWRRTGGSVPVRFKLRFTRWPSGTSCPQPPSSWPATA